MKKLVGLCAAVILLVGSWFIYQKVTDDTYEGMTIIPEEQEDIPLFEGLKPKENEYEIKGNRWEDIYNFYVEELPKNGWKVDHIESSLDDNHENESGGFYSRWIKEGFDGELWVSATYIPNEEKTEVKFDKTELLTATEWFSEVPESLCVYQNPSDETCTKIEDKSAIKGIIDIINNAYDREKPAKMEKNSLIEISGERVEVLYEDGGGVMFKSDKGMKFMKPEEEFFEWTGLPYEWE